jgi:CspA family cold shock protein
VGARYPQFQSGKRRPRMRQMGTVKFFNQTKGFGFITPDQGGKDVFVHITAVERSGIGPLDEGTRVSFDTEPDKRGKGPKAVNLQLAGE